MAKNHQPVQAKPHENFVHIPTNIEYDSATLINRTGNTNQKPSHWPTIILCIIFVITGQSIAKLLENFFSYNGNRQNDGVWTQYLLQSVGFPLLLLPFYIFTTKKHNQQPPVTSDRSSSRLVLSFSGFIGILLTSQGRLYGNGNHEHHFRVFALTYTTQLFFTPIFAAFINNIKLNQWIVISMILAIVTGALTFSSSFSGEPVKAEENYARGSRAALFAGICFSLLLCNIQNVFKCIETTTKKTSFASVFELIIFSSTFATIISVVGLLLAGEQQDLQREMNGFSKGKFSYVMAMVAQAVSWQIYWVGIVGLVFSVSSVLTNMINVITWSIVSVLVVIFFN